MLKNMEKTVSMVLMTPYPVLKSPPANEIAALRKEAQSFKLVREALRSPELSAQAAKMAFEKVKVCG